MKIQIDIVNQLKAIDKNQSWLAEKCNLTRQSITNYVRELNGPKQGNITKMYNAINQERESKGMEPLKFDEFAKLVG